jgi:O-acetyl-ADP-ribose deacetylase (regulator of RNase III)/predicted CopG family antitoxin
MPFSIIREDITRLDTDAIVNAANNHLLAGGGVCGAIFTVAGADELQKACNEIGYCETGDAVITKGFNLKAKYIIHAVGPVYGQNPKEEEQQLYSCYRKSLEIAKKNHLESIAFPLISSGIYGYPKTEAIKIATKAIKDFLAKNEMQIYLVVYDKQAFGISKKLFDKVKSYIDDKLVKSDTRRSIVFNTQEDSMQLTVDAVQKTIFEKYEAQIAYPKAFNTPFDKKDSLDELLKKKTETFSEMLLRLIDEKRMTDVDVYKSANIDRKLFSKIRKKDYTPNKVTVIALIIALKLNMDEANELLRRAGFAFSECNKFDVIIEYFIENEMYDIFEINETLFAFDQQLLGV